jgi:HK97 gp10 family phage protein
MAASDFQITGLDELYRQLQALPTRIEKNIMVGAMRAGQNVFKARAQARVPIKSGALRKSIKVKTSSRFGKAKAVLSAGNNQAWYAHIIEFGSGSFYAGQGSKSLRAPYVITPKEGGGLFFNNVVREQVTHPGVRPRPFMRPALDEGLEAPLTAVADYIRARLAREVAGN